MRASWNSMSTKDKNKDPSSNKSHSKESHQDKKQLGTLIKSREKRKSIISHVWLCGQESGGSIKCAHVNVCECTH